MSCHAHRFETGLEGTLKWSLASRKLTDLDSPDHKCYGVDSLHACEAQLV